MADAITLFESGYFAGGISLIYNASTQTTYKSLYGMQIQAAETDVLLHVPDYGEAQPVRAIDTDRVFFFELNVDGGSNNATANALARLSRWVDGASSPALRYHMLGDAVELRLRVQLDGATNYTESSVKWGFVDAGASWFSAPAMLNDQAFGVVVALRLAPYSEGASISLKNYLSNGDMLVEGATSGRAHFVANTLTGSVTLTLDTTTYLVNGQSQKCVTPSNGAAGYYSSAVTASISSDLCAFAWVYVESGGNAVTMYLHDGSLTQVDSAKTTDAGLATIVDRSGNTWARLECSGSNTGAANAYIEFQRQSGDGGAATTFYVDAAYLEVGTQTVPSSGWTSYYNLDNRADETMSTMGQRNWLDLALIPGDAPALAKMTFDGAFAASQYDIIMGRVTDGKHLAADQVLAFESDLFVSAGSSTNGAWSAGTGTSDNHFYRFTASGGTGSGSRFFVFNLTTLRRLYAIPRRLFIRVRSSSTASIFSLTTDAPSTVSSNSFSVTAANTWELIDVGLMNGTGIFPEADDVPSGATTASGMTLFVSAVPNSGTADFDYIWMPWTQEFLIANLTNVWLNTRKVLVNGQRQTLVNDSGAIDEPNRLGTMWYVAPGLAATRTTLASRDDDDAHVLTEAYAVTTEIVPRTRQLLGTV